MKQMLAIASRELRAAFATPFAYLICAAFVFLASFFFLGTLSYYNTQLYNSSLLGQNIKGMNDWVINPFLNTLEIIFLFICPMLTMRTFPEERKNYTFEMLLTAPVSVTSIIWGKFIGLAAQIAVLMLITFSFPLALTAFAEPELLPAAIGVFGLLLFALSLLSLGLAVSALAKSQTMSGVMSFVLMLLWYVADAPAGKLQGSWISVLHYIAPASHTDPFFRGIFSAGNLIYFLSVILLGMFFATRALEAERWRS